MPIRVVIDTNILVSALLSARGAPHFVFEHLHGGRFQLVLSVSLQQEYESVLARPVFAKRFGLTEEEIAAFLRVLYRRAEVVEGIIQTSAQVRDPNDTHVLSTAVAGHADYLVTGDDDLLSLADDERIQPLRIVTPRAFLAALAADPH